MKINIKSIQQKKRMFHTVHTVESYVPTSCLATQVFNACTAPVTAAVRVTARDHVAHRHR